MAYVFYNGSKRTYEIRRWNGTVYEYLPVFDDFDEAVKYCNDAGIKFPVRLVNDGCSIDVINTDEEINHPTYGNVVESFFFHDYDSESALWNRVKEYFSEMNFKEENITIDCDAPSLF